MLIGLTDFNRGYAMIQFIAENNHSVEYVLKLHKNGSFHQLTYMEGEGSIECELSDLVDSLNLNFTSTERVAMQQTLESLHMVLKTQFSKDSKIMERRDLK